MILHKYLKKMETQAQKKPKYMDKDQQHRLMAAYYTAITDLIGIIRDHCDMSLDAHNLQKLEKLEKFFFNPKMKENEVS